MSQGEHLLEKDSKELSPAVTQRRETFDQTGRVTITPCSNWQVWFGMGGNLASE